MRDWCHIILRRFVLSKKSADLGNSSQQTPRPEIEKQNSKNYESVTVFLQYFFINLLLNIMSETGSNADTDSLDDEFFDAEDKTPKSR